MATLHFKGKSAVWNHHLSVPYQTLDKVAGMSHKGKDEDENLIIEGDNLIALKALLPKYQGKIKCIYIDPPYNTGNEGWVYSDNVSNPIIKSWIRETVGKEGEDLTRHDKWLCMMTPRMKLLRELLAEGGAIFVSIDDNEQHNLRSLLNEVFGDQNFVTNIVWQKKYTRSNDAKYFSDNHDFILVYAKNIENFEVSGIPRTSEQNERYKNPDNDSRGEWMSQPLHAKSGSDSGYQHTFENGVVWSPPSGTYPRYTQESLKLAEKEGRIWFGVNGTNVPRMKKYLTDMGDLTPMTIWTYKEVGSNGDAKSDVKKLFGDNIFETPKPVSLIKQILRISTNENSIVLDSFAGSGTTAQAVLELNMEDGGDRKFVLIQIPEETGADSVAYKAGFKNVQEITQARVKKVIERDDLDVGFAYHKLGNQIDADK